MLKSKFPAISLGLTRLRVGFLPPNQLLENQNGAGEVAWKRTKEESARPLFLIEERAYFSSIRSNRKKDWCRIPIIVIRGHPLLLDSLSPASSTLTITIFDWEKSSMTSFAAIGRRSYFIHTWVKPNLFRGFLTTFKLSFRKPMGRVFNSNLHSSG